MFILNGSYGEPGDWNLRKRKSILTKDNKPKLGALLDSDFSALRAQVRSGQTLCPHRLPHWTTQSIQHACRSPGDKESSGCGSPSWPIFKCQSPRSTEEVSFEHRTLVKERDTRESIVGRQSKGDNMTGSRGARRASQEVGQNTLILGHISSF